MSLERATIPLDQIDASQRLRAIDPDHAALIAANMASKGLQTPIEVRPAKKADRYILVVGGHRLAAAKLLGWEAIEAYVLDVTADQARLREIDENLYRHELSELDRAVFLAERKALYEKLHPETKHGGDRRSDQVAILGDLAPRFTEDACDKLGVSERTLQRMIARAAIAPAVRARISGTRLARTGAELDALVRLPPDEQAKAVDLLLSGKEDAPTSVAAATRLLRGERKAVPDASDAKYAALLAGWRRADKSARDRFLDFLEQEGALAPAEREAA